MISFSFGCFRPRRCSATIITMSGIATPVPILAPVDKPLLELVGKLEFVGADVFVVAGVVIVVAA